MRTKPSPAHGLLLAVSLWLGALGASAAESPLSGDEKATYAAKIEARTTEIVKKLSLRESAKEASVHDIILAQYRRLNDWHEANDKNIKQLSKEAGQKDPAVAAKAKERLASLQTDRKELHRRFIDRLAELLSPEQVELVKDLQTYNKVQVTYHNYCLIIPNLSEADKEKILELLKEAREEAMDGGSAEEKSAVFNQYKGKINNYLSAQGHDVAKAYKDWGKKQNGKNDANAPGGSSGTL